MARRVGWVSNAAGFAQGTTSKVRRENCCSSWWFLLWWAPPSVCLSGLRGHLRRQVKPDGVTLPVARQRFCSVTHAQGLSRVKTHHSWDGRRRQKRMPWFAGEQTGAASTASLCWRLSAGVRVQLPPRHRGQRVINLRDSRRAKRQANPDPLSDCCLGANQ